VNAKKLKPELKSQLITVIYWSCGDPDHRHRSEQIALDCIAKRERAKVNAASTVRWNKSMLAAVLARFRDGHKKSAIARELGLSHSRISQVIAKAERLEGIKEAQSLFRSIEYHLSVRTLNCLRAANIKTVDEIRVALSNGSLQEMPNFGRKSEREVMEWLKDIDSIKQEVAA